MLTESYYHDTSLPLATETVNQLLEKAKDNTDNHVIWARPYEKMTHKEFYDQAIILAKGLLAMGLKRGDTFISLGSHGSDTVLLLVACTMLGIKYTANYLYAPISNVMTMMITKIKPTAILVGNGTSGKKQEHVCTEFTKVFEGLSSEETQCVSHIIYDRKAESDSKCKLQEGWKSFSDIMKLGREGTVDDETLQAARDSLAQDEPFIYLCSSGSTGSPKIVLVSARAIANGVVNSRHKNPPTSPVFGCSDMIEGDVKLVLVGLSCLCLGCDMVVYPEVNSFDDDDAVVKEVVEITAKYKVQIVIHRMDYVTRIVDNPSYKEQYDLRSLAGFAVGGSLVSLEFKKKAMEFAPFSIDGYAGTEFLYSVNPVPMKMLPPARMNTVGIPNVNVEMKIVDENGGVVPVNVKGELLVRGWPLFIEYKDQPELTAKALNKDGWYMTGDMVSMDEGGYLFHYGRLSNAERWKVNTRVVYSISIESVLITHPQVRTCAAIGTDNGKGHDINYVIEPAPGSSLTKEAIKEFAMEKMYNSQEWPIRVFFYTYDELPKTSGSRPKPHRRDLTELITKRVQADPSDGLV